MLYLLCYQKQNNESHVCDTDVGLLKPCSWLSIVVCDKTHLYTCQNGTPNLPFLKALIL